MANDSGHIYRKTLIVNLLRCSDVSTATIATRKEGAILPIVEYGQRVWAAAEIERKAHDFLNAYHVDGEWFRCSVSDATNAIRCAAGNQRVEVKPRDEWIEEQARELVTLWRGDWHIPSAMRPRVEQLRKEAQQKEKEARKRSERNANVLLAILVAGSTVLLFAPLMNLFWKAISALVVLGCLSLLVQYVASGVDKKIKSSKMPRLQIYGLPALASWLLVYLEWKYKPIPFEPAGAWVMIILVIAGIGLTVRSLERD
jgi:hypothetical protein